LPSVAFRRLPAAAGHANGQAVASDAAAQQSKTRLRGMKDTDVAKGRPWRDRRPFARWLWLLLSALVLAAVGLALGPRLLAKARAGAGDAPPPPVTLEFTPAEVTRPSPAAMPLVIEFSGPLVAPRTAVVRAKAAGTLLARRWLKAGE